MFTHVLAVLLLSASIVALGLQAASLALVFYYYDTPLLLQIVGPDQVIDFDYFSTSFPPPRWVAALPFQAALPVSVIFALFALFCIVVMRPKSNNGYREPFNSSRMTYVYLPFLSLSLTVYASAVVAYTSIGPEPWRYTSETDSLGRFVQLRDYGLESHVCAFIKQQDMGQYAYFDGITKQQLPLAQHCAVAKGGRWTMIPVVVLGVLTTAALCWKWKQRPIDEYSDYEKMRAKAIKRGWFTEVKPETELPKPKPTKKVTWLRRDQGKSEEVSEKSSKRSSRSWRKKQDKDKLDGGFGIEITRA